MEMIYTLVISEYVEIFDETKLMSFCITKNDALEK